MDFIRDLNYLLWSSSDSDDDFGARNAANGRRQYRMRKKAVVADYDDTDLRLYYRMDKPTFWIIHGLVREKLDGDRRR